ncbi:MAG: hypothetical protein ACM3JJ_05970 [Hyphomicrobiales bacterium]
MKLELKRIAPLRAANVAALVYGLLTCVFAILFAPFFLLMGLVSQNHGGAAFGPLFALGMMVLYPIIGVVVGWLTGLFGAWFYNLVIRISGGLLFDLDEVRDAAAGT